MKKWIESNLVSLAWAQAWVATLGSLYFSEIKKWQPCILCWYQRILMYPLVIILLVGMMKKDKNVVYYVLPLSLIGVGISLYHNLLQWGILPEEIAPCTFGVPCVGVIRPWFGWLSIPLLSLTAFLMISFLMVWQLKIAKRKPAKTI